MAPVRTKGLRDELTGLVVDHDAEPTTPNRQLAPVIAARLGYSEPSTFARAFRRRAGVSPGAFRDRPDGVTRPADEIGASGRRPPAMRHSG